MTILSSKLLVVWCIFNNFITLNKYVSNHVQGAYHLDVTPFKLIYNKEVQTQEEFENYIISHGVEIKKTSYPVYSTNKYGENATENEQTRN